MYMYLIGFTIIYYSLIVDWNSGGNNCCDIIADFSISLQMLHTDQKKSPVTQKSDSKH